MSEYEHLEFQVDNGIATITLNRPDATNAFNLTLALAKSIAQGVTNAFGSVKSLVLSGFHESLESRLALEVEEIIRNAAAKDGQEGIHAFLNKRQPKFTG